MSDESITYQQYWAEVESIAESVAQEAHEHGADVHDTLHEAIDNHQWIIYYSYNLSVLQHTKNEDAYIDAFGEPPQRDNFRDIVQSFAYAALEQDVVGAGVHDKYEALMSEGDEDESEDESEDEPETTES